MLDRTAPEDRGLTSSRKFVTLFGAIVIYLAALLVLMRPAAAVELAPWTDGPQPYFSLPAIDGSKVALSAPHEGALVVHFFATRCESCRNEFLALDRPVERAGKSATDKVGPKVLTDTMSVAAAPADEENA